MRRVATITADDGRVKLTIKVVAETESYQLTNAEQRQQIHHAARLVANSLHGIVYADFGADNTRVDVR